MFESIQTFLQENGKLLVFGAAIIYFLVANGGFLLAKVRPLLPTFGNHTSPSASSETSINETLLASNSRQQSFYYLERLRDYATELNATEALKTLDTLQANLFNIPSSK